MKKLLLIVFTISISLLTISTKAQGIGDWIDNLGTEISFGYTAGQKVSVKEINNDKIVIESPTITNITKYTLMYNEFPLVEILEDTNLLSQTKEKPIELTTTQDKFTIELSQADSLDINKKYYLFIIPKDSKGNLGEVSSEIGFRISDKTYGDAGSSEIYSAENHNAAGADMSLANITHTINGNTIELKRISVNGSNYIDLFVMTPDSTSFNKVANVNINDEKYSFIANRNGEYIFQFTPDNGGKQVNYTVQMDTASSVNPTPNPTPNGAGGIKVVPKTGPKENMIIIVITAFLGYLIYKKLYNKAK